MNAPRKVVISRADRDRVLREAILDESKVRVSLHRTRTAATGARTAPEVTAKKVVINRADRDRVLREAILDESKVRVSLAGTRRADTTPDSADAAGRGRPQ